MNAILIYFGIGFIVGIIGLISFYLNSDDSAESFLLGSLAIWPVFIVGMLFILAQHIIERKRNNEISD